MDDFSQARRKIIERRARVELMTSEGVPVALMAAREGVSHATIVRDIEAIISKIEWSFLVKRRGPIVKKINSGGK